MRLILLLRNDLERLGYSWGLDQDPGPTILVLGLRPCLADAARGGQSTWDSALEREPGGRPSARWRLRFQPLPLFAEITLGRSRVLADTAPTLR